MTYLAARRQAEKARRRADILDAAEVVAAREGIEAFTMDQVGREAQLSRALLYVYFHDKADLTAALCERALCELHERFRGAAGSAGQGIEQVRAIGRAYVTFARERPVRFELLARLEAREPPAGPPPANLQACLAASDRVHDVLLQALAAGLADGSITRRAGEPNTVAMSLWALMHGVLQVAKLKAGVLAGRGVSATGLVEQALAMATTALTRS